MAEERQTMRNTNRYGLILLKGADDAMITVCSDSLDVLCACAMSFAEAGWHVYDILGVI